MVTPAIRTFPFVSSQQGYGDLVMVRRELAFFGAKVITLSDA